jgi:hypothetical protein
LWKALERLRRWERAGRPAVSNPDMTDVDRQVRRHKAEATRTTNDNSECRFEFAALVQGSFPF